MSLSVFRMKAYGFGALAGAFGALTVVAARRGRYGRAVLAFLVALVCGTLSVANEAAAGKLDASGE
jgi:hypothetical protein